MTFARPSLTALIDRAAADIETQLPGVDARLRRSNLAVLGRVHAGAVHSLYGYLAYMAEQMMLDTCETVYLDRYAVIWGIPRLPAAFASGAVAVSGVTGAVVPSGTQFQRGDGVNYLSTADATLAAGVANVPVRATSAGVAGNCLAAVAINLVQPVLNVNGNAAAAVGGITQGTDAETDAALRARVLARIQQPPMGGDAGDYEQWAREVAGVTRVWVYPLEDGVGTVKVRFLRDGDANPFPDAAAVAAVQAYLDERRPVTAQVTVTAPTASAVNMTIALTPNTVAVRDAVTAELQDLLRREGRPGGTLLLSHIREAISVAAGETNHVLATPTADLTFGAGAMPQLGVITWS